MTTVNYDGELGALCEHLVVAATEAATVHFRRRESAFSKEGEYFLTKTSNLTQLRGVVFPMTCARIMITYDGQALYNGLNVEAIDFSQPICDDKLEISSYTHERTDASTEQVRKLVEPISLLTYHSLYTEATPFKEASVIITCNDGATKTVSTINVADKLQN